MKTKILMVLLICGMRVVGQESMKIAMCRADTMHAMKNDVYIRLEVSVKDTTDGRESLFDLVRKYDSLALNNGYARISSIIVLNSYYEPKCEDLITIKDGVILSNWHNVNVKPVCKKTYVASLVYSKEKKKSFLRKLLKKKRKPKEFMFYFQ